MCDGLGFNVAIFSMLLSLREAVQSVIEKVVFEGLLIEDGCFEGFVALHHIALGIADGLLFKNAVSPISNPAKPIILAKVAKVAIVIPRIIPVVLVVVHIDFLHQFFFFDFRQALN